jgi:two-component sensor histidine kinase
MAPFNPSRKRSEPTGDRQRIRVTEAVEAELPRQRTCGVVARRIVESEYGAWLDSRTLEDLKLVVSELATNAYLHGIGRIRLKLEADEGRVRVAVMDEGQGATIKIRQVGAGGGNGLRLVDHLCSRWGAFEGSTHVWAELPIDPPRGGPSHPPATMPEASRGRG